MDGFTDSMDISLSGLLIVGDGQGGLACFSPWGHKESDTTEQLSTAQHRGDLQRGLARVFVFLFRSVQQRDSLMHKRMLFSHPVVSDSLQPQ